MRTLISTLLLTCLATTAMAQEPPEGDYDLQVVAKTADGYTISHSIFEYYPEDILPDAFKAGWGWGYCGSGEPLDLVLDGPLSSDDFDPMRPGSCPEGTDPAAIAAFQGNMVFLRYGFSGYRCPFPAHPSGRFYAASLPDGGTVILRLPAEGVEPAEAYAEWQGERYPLEPMTVAETTRQMIAGDAHPEEPEGSLETQVARTDCLTMLAETEGDEDQRAQLLAEAADVVERCIERYHERHGEYPEQLSDLTTIPGAVIARLPYNPFAPGQQLGLEDPPSGIGIRYHRNDGDEQPPVPGQQPGYMLIILGVDPGGDD